MHQVTKVDCQPGPSNDFIVVSVLGQMRADQDSPLGFSQVFQLKRSPNGGSFYVLNDIFVLHLHHN